MDVVVGIYTDQWPLPLLQQFRAGLAGYWVCCDLEKSRVG